MGSYLEFENYILVIELEEFIFGFLFFFCMYEDVYIRLVSLGGFC